MSPEHVATLKRGGVKSKRDLQERLFHASNEALHADIHMLVNALSKKVGSSSVAVQLIFELIGFILWGLFSTVSFLFPEAPRSFSTTAFITFAVCAMFSWASNESFDALAALVCSAWALTAAFPPCSAREAGFFGILSKVYEPIVDSHSRDRKRSW